MKKKEEEKKRKEEGGKEETKKKSEEEALKKTVSKKVELEATAAKLDKVVKVQEGSWGDEEAWKKDNWLTNVLISERTYLCTKYIG